MFLSFLQSPLYLFCVSYYSFLLLLRWRLRITPSAKLVGTLQWPNSIIYYAVKFSPNNSYLCNWRFFDQRTEFLFSQTPSVKPPNSFPERNYLLRVYCSVYYARIAFLYLCWFFGFWFLDFGFWFFLSSFICYHWISPVILVLRYSVFCSPFTDFHN